MCPNFRIWSHQHTNVTKVAEHGTGTEKQRDSYSVNEQKALWLLRGEATAS